MTPKRSRRRADLERMKAKARKVYPHDKKARAAEHLAACSCHMCGNPRRFGGSDRLTMQERRLTLDEQTIFARAHRRGVRVLDELDATALVDGTARMYPKILAKLAD